MIGPARIEANHGAAPADTRSECAHRQTDAALHRSGSRACRMPAFLPFHRFRATTDAILETVAGVGDLVVILPRHVLEAELYRIDFQLMGDMVHHRLDAEDALRISRSAQVGRYRHVRVD